MLSLAGDRHRKATLALNSSNATRGKTLSLLIEAGEKSREQLAEHDEKSGVGRAECVLIVTQGETERNVREEVSDGRRESW